MVKERRRRLAASAMVRARRDRASGAPSPLATRCRACSTSMSLHSTLRNDATNVAAVSPPTFLTSAAGQAQHWSFVRSIQQAPCAGTKQCKDLHKVIKQTYRQINIGALSELPTATEIGRNNYHGESVYSVQGLKLGFILILQQIAGCITSTFL